MNPSDRDENLVNKAAQNASMLPAERLLFPFQKFARIEASGGILLILCTLAALFWANSPWAGTYEHLLETEFGIKFGKFVLEKPLHFWINDGLMTVFFFVVGLEIKREFLVGELSSPKQAALPIVAALGGMIVPAGIYALFNSGKESAGGWGIPMATDIAFALGVLTLLGNRIPVALKVFLVSLAIVDDIGAVLVIAVFYTEQISYYSLGIAAAILTVLTGANVMGVRNPYVYGLWGVCLWLAFLESGVHATISGVLLAMTIPARSRMNIREFVTRARALLENFKFTGEGDGNTLSNKEHQESLHALERSCEHVATPAQRLEHFLHPWVTFMIMPLFALSNAGVSLSAKNIAEAFHEPATLGILAGLVLGKQTGITLFSFMAVRAGIAVMPAGSTWRHLYGAAWLGGIGFTMSIFIAGLAFEGTELLSMAKVGIFAASLVSGFVGWLLLVKTPATETGNTDEKQADGMSAQESEV